MSAEPVTVVVSRRVRHGSEAAYDAWSADAIEAASQRPGYLGASVLRPGKAGEDWHLVYRFDSPERLAGWEESPERAALLRRLEPITEAERAHRVTGLETWFSLPGQAIVPPPRWKMALLTVAAVLPLQVLFALTVAPHLHVLLLRSAVLAVALVSVMTWLVMPQLTALVKGWLYPPR